MGKKRPIRQLAEELYDDVAVTQAVLAHAEELGNVGRIESGEMVLPSAQDAKHWHRRVTGQQGMSDEQAQQHARITALEQLVAELKKQQANSPEQRVAVLEQRIRELEGGES